MKKIYICLLIIIYFFHNICFIRPFNNKELEKNYKIIKVKFIRFKIKSTKFIKKTQINTEIIIITNWENILLLIELLL